MSAKSGHHHFHSIDILIAVISLGTFVLDVGTDIFVCLELLLDGHYVWGWLMVGFVAFPALLMNAFSISWHVHDKSATWPVVMSHLFLLAPAERYCKVIQLGIKSYRTQKAVFTLRALRSQSDVSILRLFEAFLESAPQLVLQLYIIFHSNKGSWFAGVSAVCSLVSLTWAMTAYSDSQRRAHCSLYKRRMVRLLMHYLWQLFMTGSRIAAFVFCAFALRNLVLAVMGGHWLIAFIWISIRGTDFGTDCCERWMFRVVCGFIYIFVFLNLNDGISRWRVTAYYVLVLLENTGMLVVYVILDGNVDGIVTAFVFVYGSYMLGLVCMALYYSYLHPTGRKKCLYPRKQGEKSGPSSSDDPQIFSIESPKLENDMTVMEGPCISLTLNSTDFLKSVQNHQVTHLSSASSKASHTVSCVSQEALHAAWQRGMVSSSSSSNSSSASLASNIKVSFVKEGKRTASVKSVNSHASSSSENQLLPSEVGGKNDLSKPSRQEPDLLDTKVHHQSNDFRKDISKSDNNINMQSNLSESPTLSRGSWARLSDHNRQSVTLGDFTVLGFDDDSSLDRRPSDCSSLNSQPKSLSPMNVSSLLKDVHSRLRSTIAATIAAATSNPSSSSEGTPNRSRSLASSVSIQDESLTSGNMRTASLNHMSYIGESVSKEKNEEDQPLNLSLQSMPKKRESLSSLPDTPQTFSPDQMSDVATTDSSYNRFGSESNKQQLQDLDSGAVIEISGKSPSTFSKASYSSYPEDSTLTASKLDAKARPSYFEAFSQNGYKFDSPGISQPEEPLDLSISSTVSAKNSDQKNSSPFTDQELVTVMAKSLQVYLRDTPGRSPNPEREGLALTIEDLRISRENSPQAQLNQDRDGWKSRSASSLFHDSTDTSPASSASKMNRAASVAKAEAKLSPNALKQLEVSPQTFSNLSCTSLQERSQNNLKQTTTSHGLKFIMDSYGQASVISPNTTVVHCANPEEKWFTFNKTNCIGYSNETTETSLSSKKSPETEFSKRDRLHHVLRDSCRKSVAENAESYHHVSFESTPGPGLSAKDLDLSFPEVWSGRSHTNRSNTHHQNFPLLQYSRSPFQQISNEAEGYVSGRYYPPLCTNIKLDFEENSVERNLDFSRRNSYDLNSVEKNIHNLSVEKNTKLSNNKQNFNTERTFQKDMRRGVMKKNLFSEKQTSDLLHLRHSPIPSSHYSCTDYQAQSDLHVRTNPSGLQWSSADDIQQYTNSHITPAKTKCGGVYGKLSEEELQKSAKHVTDYFSQVFESEAYNKRASNSPNKSTLKIHHKRSPLQQLDNAQHRSPGTSSYHKSLNKSHHDLPSSPASSRPPLSTYQSERLQISRDPTHLQRQKRYRESSQN
ncbi:XK-related protein [Elysia marginata]|uniref:XK-related protein n=1 Tax=Elysia marginata TaxID=1093978 RepID=A0AAV4HA62_9GAST|nr:XK-related protein [Elysia marginata]